MRAKLAEKIALMYDTLVNVLRCKSYPRHVFHLFSFPLFLLSLFCDPDWGLWLHHFEVIILRFTC